MNLVATVQLVLDFGKIDNAVTKAGFKNFGHAANRIRTDAISSIQFGKGPSQPGTPPHTHGARLTKKGKPRRGQLQRAIVYDADATSAMIGPRASIVGKSGAAHEFGGEYMGENYPERPFMGPAMLRNIDRFASDWEGSVIG